MIFWLSSCVLCAFLALSAASYLFHQPTIQGIRELGLPDYLRVQLAVLKFLAIPALIAPGMPDMLREWAYAAVALFLITAIVAHAAHRDPFFYHVINLALIGVLIVSRLHSGL
ncbi:DoxX-like protein [Aliiruegeria haliotis]|uniref:DoxX-like protein n=1 Tax=Aliiruegeria haliotis TaxID=1280846 RepID=A0A2T0RH73_9RHOB|nr:DoxX family protein [Aliiruegeria haliotis]PRY20523.1 DoxX-like protein [Aliiruegeria haliotis]